MSEKKIKLGIVMDPIETIDPKKDSSLAMLLEAKKRNYEIYYMQQQDLKLIEGKALADAHIIDVFDNNKEWFKASKELELNLKELNVILMRKDPPFDMEFIYTTYILDKAEQQGVLVVNKPSALRDMNEKVYTSWFPECTPPTLITRSMKGIKSFLKKYKKLVIKPLDGMGGKSIFVLNESDKNTNVILETLTDHGTRYAMSQLYIPEITKGDKRILLIDGKPIPHALARIPPEDDNRGNLVMGAKGEGRDLTERDEMICESIGETLRNKGVLFCGIDVIGDYLTEINSTSPTGIKELDRIFDINIAGVFFDAVEKKLNTN
jgi:glutathione synthase